MAERFAAASVGGDIAALMTVLDPDVDGEATPLGAGPIAHSQGAGEVATRVMALFGPSTRRRLAAVPLGDRAALVGLEGDRALAVLRIESRSSGAVRHITAFLRPPG